jgi:ABC-type polysaccharide/polyol phosphate transport system ATPase subunit
MSATVRPVPRQVGAATPRRTAVSVAHVSKAFRLPHEHHHTLKGRVLHPFRSSSYDVLRAVDDVSLEVQTGEFFGIVGRNGSGKSTLLKCIAGIYDIDGGELRVSGRLSPFIELGVGFNNELTARDNVMVNAIMLGLTRKEARERFDRIIAFAELEEFLDLKLKNYSSGMQVRLAFSVAIQVEADILLIDEVLAVGDAAFQQKCYGEFDRLKAEGRTIVFVTHDMGAIERFCDRAMLLQKGRMVAMGQPAAIARRYIQLNLGRTVHELGEDDEQDVQPAPPAEILDAWFENDEGVRVAKSRCGAGCYACIEVRFNETVEDPVFGATLRNEWGATVFATTTAIGHGPTGRFTAGQVAVVRLWFENWLADSGYTLSPSVAPSEDAAPAFDLREDAASIVIHGGPLTGGVAHLPHEFEVLRR